MTDKVDALKVDYYSRMLGWNEAIDRVLGSSFLTDEHHREYIKALRYPDALVAHLKTEERETQWLR